MNKIACRLALVLLGGAVIASCDSSTSEPLAVDFSFPMRQILAIDDYPLQIDVVVNNGPNQRFTIPGGQPSLSRDITGIRQGETNTIQITWTEILNGYPVILATQEQQFFASGSVAIDAEHMSGLFDNDADGVSNLEERNNGSCVWYADNECLTDGGLDVPPNAGPETLTATESGDVFIHAGFAQTGTLVSSDQIDNGTETIREADFTDGDTRWFSPDGATFPDNTMCIPFQSGQVGVQESVVFYDVARTPYEIGTYVVQFDVRVDRFAPVAISLTAPGVPDILDHYVQGSTEWQTHTIEFESNSITSGGIGFNAVRSAGLTTYCFDNIKLGRL